MKNNSSIKISHVQDSDKSFWFTLDKHLQFAEFYKKVRDKQGYVLFADESPIGILRYNLFWDNTPFCTLLYIDENYRNKGYGKTLMRFWEEEMRVFGYDWVLTSTQVDEEAQHFYRKIGYTDAGQLTVPNQATELFLSKFIR